MTGDVKYLNLAKFFIDLRGRAGTHKLRGADQQDHQPIVKQDEAVGHAVRAGYFYSGVADVAALTGDAAYAKAIDRIWENVSAKKLYLTGGIGARHAGEAFGENYELPNATAYNETCAAIANALWNERMFLLHGDAKYLDVLERVIYNGFLSGVALTGSEFFYPNPLASGAGYAAAPGSAAPAARSTSSVFCRSWPVISMPRGTARRTSTCLPPERRGWSWPGRRSSCGKRRVIPGTAR